MKRTPAKPSADADRKRRDAEKWRLLQAQRLLSEFRRVKGGRS